MPIGQPSEPEVSTGLGNSALSSRTGTGAADRGGLMTDRKKCPPRVPRSANFS